MSVCNIRKKILFAIVMKIVLDENIPFIKERLQQIAEVISLPASAITADTVHDADALVIRTRTKCNEALLAGSKVQFIATATIGFDHIDAAYLRRQGIEWTSCPGCNSGAVAQYIRSSLLQLSRYKNLDLKHSTLGIVGYGHVGHKVKVAAEQIGMRVLLNDPPREEKGCTESYVSLDDMERNADVITFHVPFSRDGSHPTYHLADERFFSRLARTPFIINSSRGGVVDNAALLEAIMSAQVADAVIDTWENEPDINTGLLKKVFIGTPHIAGYSLDGKINADNMVIDALCRHFGIDNKYQIEMPPSDTSLVSSDDTYGSMVQLYNPLIDSEQLKSNPSHFESLRDHYKLRREN